MAEPNKPAYYRPYLASDSELSDADSDTDTWTRTATPRPENANPDFLDERVPIAAPDFSALARALQSPPTSAGGPSFITTQQEDIYSSRRLDPHTYYYPYSQISSHIQINSNLQAQLPVAPQIQAHVQTTSRAPAQGSNTTTTSNIDTVVMLRSRDRDRSIYPQPTACQLFLPRVYKNVVGFSVAQINMISAFFYFSIAKQNIAIEIYEQNTRLYDTTLYASLASIIPRAITNNIREGSYNITQLLTELQIQLNNVPLFYDFLNGFSDFLPLFSVNGDYSINFNYPGDYYYDAVRKIYIQNPTRAQIVSYYFQSQFANQFIYTTAQIRIAYYYPVIKEAFLDTATDLATYNLTGTGLSEEDTVNYLIYSFQGIDDPIATIVINNNIPMLDEYRLLHTFRYSLVNEYVCSYNPTNNRVTIQCPTLNNSLVNLLNAQYNSYLSQQLAKYGITAAIYNSLAATNTNLLSIIQAMYEFLQINFANFFAINYGTYSRGYYAITSNTVFVRYGLNALGIATQYSPTLPPPRETDILNDFRTNPPTLWPRMSNLPSTEGAERNMGDPSDLYPQSSNFPYNLQQSNINLNVNFIDLDFNVYTDPRRKAGDIIVNIDASKYTIFQFRSKYRQTLQVETLPRQTTWRYPAWNNGCNAPYPIKELFSNSISYTSPSPVELSHITPFDISYNPIYGWSNLSNTTNNFSLSYTDSLALWGANKEVINVTNSNGHYYFFQTPLPVNDTTQLYKYQFNVTFNSPTSLPFASDLYAFFYQDIAAFSADLANIRNELPIHYKERLLISSNTTSAVFSFNSYANQQYYIYVRPISITPPSTEYQIIPWFTSDTYTTLTNSIDFKPTDDPQTLLNYANVAIVADADYLRMPTFPSSLWNLEPPQELVNIPLLTKSVAIGYDTNEVSNDLTDYVPYSPNNFYSTINPAATVCIDPINNYIFQNNSPYDDPSQSYFYPDSKNAILEPYAKNQYTPTTVAARQYKILNYYANTYIHDSPSFTNPDTFDPLTSISPYVSSYTIATTSNTPIEGYTYDPQGRLVLGAGVCGFTFIPGDGTWAIDRITFKANFINPLASTNENIHALAVFLTGDIYYESIANMSLSNALAICLRVNETVYSDANSLNLGFDASLGTYYTFSNYPQLVTRTGTTISGFAQTSKVFIVDQNAYYSVVAYNFSESQYSNWNPTAISNLLTNFSATKTYPKNSVYTIQNLTGSPIAYPYANTAYPSTVFYDGQSPPSGIGVVLSTDSGNDTIFGPPLGADESISQYQQSIPYVNTNTHFLSPSYIIYDKKGFAPWSNLPLTPTFIHASIPNHMLFQGTTFAFTTYKTYDNVTPVDPSARNFVYKDQISPQLIYPDSENTSLIAISGNTDHYVFLGASNIPNKSYSQLRFKIYDPVFGILTELPINSNYTFMNSHLLQHFVFHNTQQWYMTSANVVKDKIIFQGDTTYSPNANSMIYREYLNVNDSELQLDPNGTFLYFAYHDGEGFNQMSIFSLNSTDPQYVRNNYTGYTINLENSTSGLPPSYMQIAVTLNFNSGFEEVLLTNTDVSPSNYYYIGTYNSLTTGTSNTTIIKSVQEFDTPPNRIIGGINGTKWCLFDNAPYILGNRNDAYDAPTAMNIAWQIFFPTMKIEMRQLTTGISPIIDLTGITYPEFPHTAMFAYSNYQTLINDMSGNGGVNKGSWGQEKNTNFMVSDVSFNGFQFNSYMMNVPLLPNYNDGTYETDYYLAVRGWLPTEQLQTMMRFYLPNKYDFGFVRFTDISNEVVLATSTITEEFAPGYLKTLLEFNSNFVFTNENFGSNTTQGFPGCNLSSSNFGDFLNQYQGFYSTFSTNTYILSNIQSNVKASMNQFVVKDMQYILPSTAVTRQRYTDPLLFQILWKSQLSPAFVTLDDEWGLGWNLGFPKQDTGFATIHTAPSFYKITEDYIYLRLNPEFNINRMDAGGKENYKITREPSGITNQYYCKLLLTSFGGNATTFIHNPISLAPPIFRLAKLEFQWIDTTGAIINNNDCEWDMVINIVEAVDMVPIPPRTVRLPQALEYTPTVEPGQTVVYMPSVAPQETIMIDQNNTIMEIPTLGRKGMRQSDYSPQLIPRQRGSDINPIGANYFNNEFSPLKETTQWAKEMGSLFSSLR